MWGIGAKRRTGWIILTLVVCLLAAIAGAIALTKIDWEHKHANPARLKRLAEVDFGATESKATRPGDWPQWRGPNRDGLSLETGLFKMWPDAGLPMLWKQPIGRGFSSSAIVNGRLYTMADESVTDTREEVVICLDAASGNPVWRFAYANHYDERFGAGPRSTPTVDGEFVYAVGPTGIFHCLRADNGQLVWRHDLQEEFHGRKMQYGVAFSPLVEGDLVYVTPGGPDGNSIAAFDKRTGTLTWKALDDPMGYSSPIAATFNGIRQILVFTNQELVSFSAKDGKQLWHFPWVTDNGFNIATPLVFGNYVFISSGYGKGCALLEITQDPDGQQSPHLVYEHNRMRNHFASSVRYGDHIYGFDQTDLVCMEIRTGKVAWREKGMRSFGKGCLTIADGRLLVLGELGQLTLAEATPTAYVPISSMRVSDNKTWTVPVVSNGKLYIRDESHLACFDLKP
jgi:outer membrane protein assembly factor BamB